MHRLHLAEKSECAWFSAEPASKSNPFQSWQFLGEEFIDLYTCNHSSHSSYPDKHSQAVDGLADGGIAKHYTREKGVNEE